MQSVVYDGTAYRQALDPTAPWLISFVAPAEDIFRWAGIPRKTDKALTGFQRPDDPPRVVKTQDFFSKFSQNQSPTSIVVGVHAPHPQQPIFAVEFVDPQPESPIQRCRVSIAFDDAEPLEDAVLRLRHQIQARIAGEAPPGQFIDGTSTSLSEEEETEEAEEATEAEDAEENAQFGEEVIENDRQEIELGKSLLSQLLRKLDDSGWCQANEIHLRDLAKPATIIDGQHRILGARACERGIPFSVIAILDCSWAEQVFQFTVVNYTATGIPDQFITANAALSLTATELGNLEDRLQQAGVKVIEYELMRIVNFDSESPFRDLVNLTPKKHEDLIGYKTMVQVAKAWYLGKDNAVRQIIEHIYPDLPGKRNSKNRLARWKQNDWGVFFKDFWCTVRDQYAGKLTENGDPLWTVGKSNLMVAVVLLQLQWQFLTNLAAQDETFFEVPAEDPAGAMRNKIKKRAHSFISYFSPEMFGKEWKMHSLSIGPGREALNVLFRNIADKKGEFQWRNSGLITGKTAGGA
jgi:hypothetical protein